MFFCQRCSAFSREGIPLPNLYLGGDSSEQSNLGTVFSGRCWATVPPPPVAKQNTQNEKKIYKNSEKNKTKKNKRFFLNLR